MRIAVYCSLPFSGAKRTVLEQVKGLRKLGHLVDVYTINRSMDLFDPGNISNNNFEYHYSRKIIKLPFFRKFTNDFNDFFILRRLQKRIAQDIDLRGYDIVVVQTDQFTQSPFVLRFLKTKNIYICLEPLKIAYEYGLRIPDDYSIYNKIYEYFNRSFRKIIDRQNARSADYSLAISYFGRELMIQSYDLYPKIFYLGVDVNIFKKKNVKKKNQVLFIGQKLNMNGYKTAVDAINLIPAKIRPKLKTLSISKNPKDPISDREIVALYNESLVTVCLSNYDTFGLVPLESMACEVPVIAYNVAAYRETIKDGVSGFLVDFDARDVASKIIYLIQNPEVAQKMGKEGRKWVEDFWTWKIQIEKLNKILDIFLKKDEKRF